MGHLGTHNGHLVTDSGHLATCEEFVDCETSCPGTVYVDTGTSNACGNNCDGLYRFDWISGCTWTPTSGPCNANPVTYVSSQGEWQTDVPYNDPDRCNYRKSGVEADCPTGTYSLYAGGCADCKNDINVYT